MTTQPTLTPAAFERIEVCTNFTGLSPVVKVVTLDDLAAADPSTALALLRNGPPFAIRHGRGTSD